MRVITLTLILWLSIPASQACAWTYGTNKEGRRARNNGVHSIKGILRRSMDTDLREEGVKLEMALRNSTSFEDRNDYAVALMYLGRSKEAVPILEKLESEIPGRYETAANLGTAYELAGNNAKAKHWIEEGIRRNPDSHDGSEWLHVQILRTKLKLMDDPAWLQKHSVLNLDYRALQSGATNITIEGTPHAVHTLLRDLEYQLSERLKFVKGTDPVVASLLYDYGIILAGTAALEPAGELLKMAGEYGFPRERIDPLLAEYSRITTIAQIKRKLLIAGPILLVLAFLGYSWKRGWFVLSRRDLKRKQLGQI